MAMRLTGMNSGLDTESLIQDLMKARRAQVDKKTKAKTKLEWKQDAWKGLNQKLKNLQSKYLSTMRFTSSYSKKTSKVSNSSAVSVITGENAVNGVQELQVKQLAKTAYLTGAKLEGKSEKDLTALSKLSDLKGFEGANGSFEITNGKSKINVNVDENTTISDVLNQLKEAGLNASFDEKNQRLFVSAKNSGAANDFSIVANDAGGAKALQALGIQTAVDKDAVTMKQYEDYAKYVGSNDAETLQNMDALIQADKESKVKNFFDQYKNAQATIKKAEEKKAEIEEKYKDTPLKSVDDLTDELKAKEDLIKEKEEALKDLSEEEKEEAQKEIDALKEDAKSISEQLSDAKTLDSADAAIGKANEKLAELAEHITVTGEGEEATATATDSLTAEIENAYLSKANYAKSVVDGEVSLKGNATKVSGQDAVILLNDAEFTSTSNTFEINGLTITANATTKDGEVITISTEQDTDGIYDMVKNFLKEYNAVINEMDKLYNAASASGYEPMTSEEKSVLSDNEVEEYEKKIKDALLRRDSGVSEVSSAMRSVMASGMTVGGKTMYLSDFGISQLGYFTAADNEKNAYHIDGDPDDGDTSGNADKLKSMIASEPDTVIDFFTQLSQKLYDKMTDMSKSVDGYRSFGSFFDDKKMKTDYDSMTSKIAEMEQKLNDYEDKWYKKFSKMETALAKMQSNANAVSSFFGTNS